MASVSCESAGTPASEVFRDDQEARNGSLAAWDMRFAARATAVERLTGDQEPRLLALESVRTPLGRTEQNG